MDREMEKLINEAKETCLNGQPIRRRTLLRLLELDPESEECKYLGRSAREVSDAVSKNIAAVGSSVGIDLVPCSMSCSFCALGKKWGLIDKEYVLSDETVIDLIRDVYLRGYGKFTLRTTEFYDLEKLCNLGRRIRTEIPGNYILTVNTGELTLSMAECLHSAGFDAAYHTLRLRESIDTPIRPETRIATMKAIRKSGLMLGCGLDPVGIEHTNEEIVDRLELFRTLGPMSVCVMKRINVKGTPVGDMEEVSNERIAQIVAVTRIAGGGIWTNVAVHPPILKGLEWGANIVTVETGANPRKDKHDVGTWEIFDQETAKGMLIDAGYNVR
ncbi:MAG: hypothetical protein WC067_00980 [Candidatus Methanomethylophilaceae archaeon]